MKKKKGRQVVSWMVLVGMIAGVAAVPSVLRRRDAFHIRIVEIEGNKYLHADTIVRLAGIDTTTNLFDPMSDWLEKLEAHPLIESVKARRRLPGTLILRLREREPIAWVVGSRLFAVDSTGSVLPILPGVTEVDLPIILTDESERNDSTSWLAVVKVLSTIHMLAPDLYVQLTEAKNARPGVGISLRDRPYEILLPTTVDDLGLERLQSILGIVREQGVDGRLTVIDLRYSNQAILRLTERAN